MRKKYLSKIFFYSLLIVAFLKIFPQRLFPGDNLIGLYHPYRDFFSNLYPAGFPYKNPLITDPFLQLFPWKYLSISAFKNLSIPLWNSYSFSGYPLMANFQSAAFFPLNILLFLPFELGWQVFILIQIPMCAIGMYLFLKKVSISHLAAIFASICYSLSGFTIGWLEWGNIGYIFALLPISLYFILCLSEKRTKKNSIFLYISLISLGLAGHLQMEVYALAVILGLIIFTYFDKKNIQNTGYIFLIFILSILSTAFQLIPTFELIQNSYRSIDIAYLNQADWFIPTQHFISLLAPDFFGSPARLNYWGVWNHLEFNLSVSVAGIFFAFLGVSRKRFVAFIFLVLVASSIFATKNPLSEVIYLRNLPFLSSAQPSRLIFIIIFCISTLSAFGIDRFYNFQVSAKKTALVSIILIACLGYILYLTFFNFTIFGPIDFANNQITAVRNMILPLVLAFFILAIISLTFLKLLPRKIAVLIIIASSVFELGYSANKFLPYSNSQMVFPQTKLIEFIRHDTGKFRISTSDDRILPPNISGQYGLESVEGYDPLYLKNYAEFISMIETGNENDVKFNRIVRPKNNNSKLFPLLNVKYVLSFDSQLNGSTPVFSEGITNVFVNKNFIPRAFTVKNIISAKDTNVSKQALLNSDFDPKSQAVVIGHDTVKSSSGNNVGGIATISLYSADKVIIETNDTQDSFLVLLDSYFPGWTAKVNGKNSQIFQTDHAFRGVDLPAGNNEVIFEYNPKSFYLGLIIAGLSMFTCIVVIARSKYVIKN